MTMNRPDPKEHAFVKPDVHELHRQYDHWKVYGLGKFGAACQYIGPEDDAKCQHIESAHKVPA